MADTADARPQHEDLGSYEKWFAQFESQLDAIENPDETESFEEWNASFKPRMDRIDRDFKRRKYQRKIRRQRDINRQQNAETWWKTASTYLWRALTSYATTYRREISIGLSSVPWLICLFLIWVRPEHYYHGSDVMVPVFAVCFAGNRLADYLESVWIGSTWMGHLISPGIALLQAALYSQLYYAWERRIHA